MGWPRHFDQVWNLLFSCRLYILCICSKVKFFTWIILNRTSWVLSNAPNTHHLNFLLFTFQSRFSITWKCAWVEKSRLSEMLCMGEGSIVAHLQKHCHSLNFFNDLNFLYVRIFESWKMWQNKTNIVQLSSDHYVQYLCQSLYLVEWQQGILIRWKKVWHCLGEIQKVAE